MATDLERPPDRFPLSPPKLAAVSLQPSIDAVAKALALADLSDLPALVALQELLLQLAEEASQADLSPVSDVSSKAAELVERLVLREIDDVSAALWTLGQAVEYAQRALQLDSRGDSLSALRSPFDDDRLSLAEGTLNIVGAPATGSPTADADKPISIPTDADCAATLPEFLAEATEHLASAEAAALQLEQNPRDAELVNTVFRAFHTIKGVAGFMGLGPIVELAHAAESMLEKARSGAIAIDHETLELILATRDMLARLASSLQGGIAPRRSELASLITRLTTGAATPAFGASEPAAPAEPAPDANIPQPATTSAPVPTQRRSDQTVKVSTQRMDSLINMVGELVIAQLMVQQDPLIATVADQRLQRNWGHMAKIVRDLQEVALSLRMVTMKATFQKMTRLVRDVSARSGKHITFQTDGEDTELDRNVVDAIADPLVHMIRNACDHGVESASDRVACGKSATGTVRLRAFHRGGMIVIEVTDDGRGLQREKILAKCRERDLLPSDRRVDELSDAEVYSYIFLPGFSTADQVTDISGRGVGMDVVKRNIEALRGKIEIRSTPGQGSTFLMQLPLTMAIIDGMLVRVGTQRYVVPTLAIERSFRPRADEVHTVLGRGEMASVRGSLLPIRRLNHAFGLTEGTESITSGLLLVLESSGTRCCVLVDEIVGQQQVVIKSLGPATQRHRGVSGGAILGDGRVALIIDVGGLLQETAA